MSPPPQANLLLWMARTTFRPPPPTLRVVMRPRGGFHRAGVSGCPHMTHPVMENLTIASPGKGLQGRSSSEAKAQVTDFHHIR